MASESLFTSRHRIGRFIIWGFSSHKTASVLWKDALKPSTAVLSTAPSQWIFRYLLHHTIMRWLPLHWLSNWTYWQNYLLWCNNRFYIESVVLPTSIPLIALFQYLPLLERVISIGYNYIFLVLWAHVESFCLTAIRLNWDTYYR